MSDDEHESTPPPPSEGELALKKRQHKVESAGLEEADKELLENNRQERNKMDDEIKELRQRNEKRKKEREIEEKRLAAERSSDDARRKADEEERKRKKEEEEIKKKGERAQKQAEFEKWKSPPKANFVISKKLAAEGGAEEPEEGEGKAKKSKEQLEAEKQAILKQRLKPLDIDGADNTKLTEKAKELHTLLSRLEGEKYDLEKRYKLMQQEMQLLAERSRQANKVGKEGTVKRIHESGHDKVMERYAGAPLKVEMFSKYERQKDKRTYVDRKGLYTGPMFGGPPDRIQPSKFVAWTEEGLPIYSEGPPAPAAAQAAA
jgi:hypothetical protein